MYTKANKNAVRDLRGVSGEELLLIAIFGPKATKQKIDRELDRRALMCSVLSGGTLGRATGLHTATGHAA
ncbi:MAG: hypothetical protein R3C45_06890 [Phycisphaerales bacterium]